MIRTGRSLRNLLNSRKIIFSCKKLFSEATGINSNEKTTHFGFKTVKESDKVKEGKFRKITNYYTLIILQYLLKSMKHFKCLL